MSTSIFFRSDSFPQMFAKGEIVMLNYIIGQTTILVDSSNLLLVKVPCFMLESPAKMFLIQQAYRKDSFDVSPLKHKAYFVGIPYLRGFALAGLQSTCMKIARAFEITLEFTWTLAGHSSP